MKIDNSVGAIYSIYRGHLTRNFKLYANGILSYRGFDGDRIKIGLDTDSILYNYNCSELK